MRYFYQANGSLISNNLFENFENNIEKLSFKKHLLQMASDTDKLNELNSRLDTLESNFTLKLNDYKNYFPFTLEDSKMMSFKESNWVRDTSTNDYIYYIEFNYESDNEPMIFSQIHNRNKTNLDYKLYTEIIGWLFNPYTIFDIKKNIISEKLMIFNFNNI